MVLPPPELPGWGHVKSHAGMGEEGGRVCEVAGARPLLSVSRGQVAESGLTRPAALRPSFRPAPPQRARPVPGRAKSRSSHPASLHPHTSSPSLLSQAATANQEQAWIARVYRGEQAKLGVADLAQLQTAAGKLNVSFDEFQHLSALVSVDGRERGRGKGGAFFFYSSERQVRRPPLALVSPAFPKCALTPPASPFSAPPHTALPGRFLRLPAAGRCQRRAPGHAAAAGPAQPRQ
jgi:hypothetical protein